MKIFSINKNNQYGILIPTRMYEIAIETDGYGLNFLEKAIKELLKIKRDMNIENIKTALGLSSINNIDSLISVIIEKLNMNKDDKQVQNQIKIFQFYQELYGGEVLPFVGTRENEKGNITNSIAGDDSFFEFELHGKSSKAFYKKPKSSKINPPTPQSIIRAINIHNQNSTPKINMVTSLNSQIPETSSIIYLHTNISFGKNGRFSIKSPFNDSFSPVLDTIFAKHCKDFISKLRSKNYTYKDIQIKQDSIVFGNELDDIRSYILSFFNNEDKKETSLFNAYEKLFERITIKNKLTILNGNIKASEICKIAKSLNFNCNESLGIFNVGTAKNLQLLLATILNGHSGIFKKIAINHPNFMINLNQLFIARNTQSHGGDKKENVDKKELNELLAVFKAMLENTASPREVDIIMSKPQEDEHKDNNGYITVENELSDVLSHFSEDDLDDLSEMYDIDEFDEVNVEIYSKIISNLYKVIERNLRKIVKPCLSSIDAINTKNLNLGSSLRSTREKYKNKALKGEEASLGAYMLVYISICENIAQTDVDFIDKLISMREHGTYSIIDINAYLPQDLKDIRKQGIDFIKKILIQ